MPLPSVTVTAPKGKMAVAEKAVTGCVVLVVVNAIVVVVDLPCYTY